MHMSFFAFKLEAHWAAIFYPVEAIVCSNYMITSAQEGPGEDAVEKQAKAVMGTRYILRLSRD